MRPKSCPYKHICKSDIKPALPPLGLLSRTSVRYVLLPISSDELHRHVAQI